MINKELIVLAKGDVNLKLYDGISKKLKKEYETNNLVTDFGKEFITRKLSNLEESPDVIKKISIGSGETFEYISLPNQKIFSGPDRFSNVLQYTPGKLTVTINGALLSPNLYTASNGIQVTLNTGTSVNQTVRISSAIVSPSDTDLSDEKSKRDIEFKFVDPNVKNKVHFISTFLGGVGTGTIREVGLFTNNDLLICKTVLSSPFTKSPTDYLIVNWKIQIG